MPSRTSLSELDSHPHAHLFPGEEPRVVRLELDAGESVPEHDHPGRDVVFAVCSGRPVVTLDDETFDLEPDDVVRFAGESTVSVRAEEDTVALLVLAERAD